MKYILSYIFILSSLSAMSFPKVEESLRDKTFWSQVAQDKFVFLVLYGICDKEGPGTYLEIGAAQPDLFNNTFFLEKELGWKGISIEIVFDYVKDWKQKRVNPLLIQDALEVDYSKLLKDFPNEIDYLSLDVDDTYVEVLKKIPFERYKFKVITIEHDAYRFGDIYRNLEREFLQQRGYRLMVRNILDWVGQFEDWWVHESLLKNSLLKRWVDAKYENIYGQQAADQIFFKFAREEKMKERRLKFFQQGGRKA
jgi:hypothetical protein